MTRVCFSFKTNIYDRFSLNEKITQRNLFTGTTQILSVLIRLSPSNLFSQKRWNYFSHSKWTDVGNYTTWKLLRVNLKRAQYVRMRTHAYRKVITWGDKGVKPTAIIISQHIYIYQTIRLYTLNYRIKSIISHKGRGKKKKNVALIDSTTFVPAQVAIFQSNFTYFSSKKLIHWNERRSSILPLRKERIYWELYEVQITSGRKRYLLFIQLVTYRKLWVELKLGVTNICDLPN